jgi:hypothetical protein
MSFSSQGTRESTHNTANFRNLPDDARTVSTDRRSILWFKTESAGSGSPSRAEKGDKQDSYELAGRRESEGKVDVDVEAGPEGDIGQHIAEPAAAAGGWPLR